MCEQLSCATCEICEEPPAVDNIDVIIQAVPIGTDKVSIWYKASVPIAGAQYDNICTGEAGDGDEECDQGVKRVNMCACVSE